MLSEFLPLLPLVLNNFSILFYSRVDSRRTNSDHEEQGKDEKQNFLRILEDETNKTTAEKWKSIVRMPSLAVNGFTDNGSTNTYEKIFIIPGVEGEKYFIYIIYNVIHTYIFQASNAG